MSIEIQLAWEAEARPMMTPAPPRLVTPGDVVTSEAECMRGHGTFPRGGAELRASVAGVVERVNKLVCVRPLKTRYNGEVGDVVVGRVTELGQKRWKVETGSRQDSVLQLSAVQLPGGELRRKSLEDELSMREYLREGDLVSAEVQNVHPDGSLSLHTRSLKYGKLAQGVLVKVSPSLVKRRKTHFHNLPCGASVIFGNNGFVWLAPTTDSDSESNTGGFVQNLEVVPQRDREVVCRLRNCTALLAANRVMLFDTSLLYAFDVSLKQGYEVKELLRADVGRLVAQEVRELLEQSQA